MKKYIISSLVMITLVFSVVTPARAATIAELQAMIAQLMAQVAAMQAQTGTFDDTSTLPSATQLTTNLALGSKSAYVVTLQNFLISEGFLTIPNGLAKGYFGPTTKAAVIKYQVANGLSENVGYVGPITRSKINSMLDGRDGGGDESGYIQPDGPKYSPYINIISPKGGEVFMVNDRLDMVYATENLSDKATLHLYSLIYGNVYSEKIGRSDGKDSRTIYPAKQASEYKSGKYKIGICDEGNVNPEVTFKPLCVWGKEFTVASSSVSTDLEKDGESVNGIWLKSAVLHSVNSDKVGIWDIFGTGKGNVNKNKLDWYWRLKINSEKATKIKSIKIEHTPAGEGWSTAMTYMYNRAYAYPLKVVGGAYENTKYVTDINLEVQKGDNYYDLYGQPESTSFKGGKITVEFADGTILYKDIPASNIKAPYGETISPISEVINCTKITPKITDIRLQSNVNAVKVPTKSVYVGDSVKIEWEGRCLDSFNVTLRDIKGKEVYKTIDVPAFKSGAFWTVTEADYNKDEYVTIHIETTDGKYKETTSKIAISKRTNTTTSSGESYISSESRVGSMDDIILRPGAHENVYGIKYQVSGNPVIVQRLDVHLIDQKAERYAGDYIDSIQLLDMNQRSIATLKGLEGQSDDKKTSYRFTGLNLRLENGGGYYIRLNTRASLPDRATFDILVPKDGIRFVDVDVNETFGFGRIVREITFEPSSTINTSTSIPLNSPDYQRVEIPLPNGTKQVIYEKKGTLPPPRILSMSKTTVAAGEILTLTTQNVAVTKDATVYVDTFKGNRYESKVRAVNDGFNQKLIFPISPSLGNGQYYVYLDTDDGVSNYRGLMILSGQGANAYDALQELLKQISEALNN
ncbi:peptidoglycan-binding protein [Candidatus Woesebacteria bacterium]|nr:peptidoglycan-binding protein [Candidatus Woesebacteria bacterium]